MDSAWEVLSNLPVGRVVAWIALIIAIISGISALTVKLYKLFEKYKKLKDTNSQVVTLLTSHENALTEVRDALKAFEAEKKTQNDIMKKQIGHSIVITAEKCIAEGKITFSEMKSITELYEVYHDVYKGNSYVKILMDKVEKLDVIGEPTQ